MKSVTVLIDVPQTPEQVYDFLDVMAHHERFTNHYLTAAAHCRTECQRGRPTPGPRHLHH